MVVAQNLLVVAVFMVLVGCEEQEEKPNNFFLFSIVTICKMKERNT
jgi:hypothetical protein